MKYTVLLLLSFSYIFSCQSQEQKSQDWPQWMGPERNAVWNLDLKKDTLLETELHKVWEMPIGTGYSGPSVAYGMVYITDYHRSSETYERVLCFDAVSGELIWKHQYRCDYEVGYPTGPRASVLLADKKAYSFGTMGDICCLDAKTGEVLWQLKGTENYNIYMPIWGLASSPIIEGDLLIVQMGGQEDACIVAFDKDSGKEVWRALSDLASYSSPTIIDQAGKRVLLIWTGDSFSGLDPETGTSYWSIPYNRSKSVINIATPLFTAPYIFLSSFYDGSMLIKLSDSDQSAKLVWERRGESERKTDALHCITSTPFIQENYIYGVDSYGEFRCLDLLTGDRIWTDSTLTPYGRWSNAHFVFQDNKIWAFNEIGELILGTVSPEGFRDLGRVKLIDPVPVSPNPRGGVNWAFPAFAGRNIYARSDGLLVCYELNE